MYNSKSLDWLEVGIALHNNGEPGGIHVSATNLKFS